MLRNVFLTCFVLSTLLFIGQDIYSIVIYDNKGNSLSLETLRGKPIMIVTLPVTRDATYDIFFETLNQVATNEEYPMHVIAAPSYEDGYTYFNKDSLRVWYTEKLSPLITITEGVYARKSSGEKQHNLFKWLTKMELNAHYDIDVTGGGQKFLINSGGSLMAVFNKGVNFNNRIFQKVIADCRPVPER